MHIIDTIPTPKLGEVRKEEQEGYKNHWTRKSDML